MKNILLVGSGGFIGAALRYSVCWLVTWWSGGWKFPAGTFAVNVVGCLVAGILLAVAVKHGEFSQSTKLLLFTGVLGGFTTFSAFGVDTIGLLQRNDVITAGLYVTATVVIGMLALWLGMFVARSV